MAAFNEIIISTIEIMTLPVLILLFAVLLYIYGSFCLLTWCLTPNQRLDSTGYRRRKIPDIKTSRSKPKKSTSVVVQLKDNIIKDTDTAHLQIFNSCEPKSRATFYNIESDSKQKMEYQREEENFITVLSKRERRSLQHKKNQQQKKDEEQQLKNQQEQRRQQLEEKQAQEKQYQSNEQRHRKLLQKQNDFPTINNIVITPIKPICAENNAWAKALQTKDDDKAKILQSEQEITESVCVDDENLLAINSLRGENMKQEIHRQDQQNHSEKEQELEKQQQKITEEQQELEKHQPNLLNQEKQQQKKPVERQELEEERQKNQEKRLQNKQQKREKPSRSEKKRQQKNSEQEQELQKQFDDAIVEATCVKDHTPIRDSVTDNEKRCKKHDTVIKDLREENEKIRVQYESSMRNNWTDNEFKTVLEGVRAEIEIKRLDAIKALLENHQTTLEELKSEHEAEVKGLHIYYQTTLNNLQLNHDIAVRTIHMNHEILVKDLKNVNYGQNQRHETAMQSLRDVNEKMSKEHQNEVRGLREKYENTIKDQEIRIKNLIEEKELLCAQEKFVRELSEKNIDQHHITIEAQITNDYDDKDVNTRTVTIADDNTVNTRTATIADDNTFNTTEMEQKLIQLHGYTSSNDSDCSSHKEDLPQQLNNVEVDALQSNACSPQKSHD